MKNQTATLLSVLSLLGVIVLFILHFSGGNKGKHMSAAVSRSEGGVPSLNIAYVNIDTFEQHYEYLKTKREAFEKKKSNMEGELQRSAAQFQNAMIAFQKKAQSGALSQSEGEAEQRRLGQMQQSLESRQQTLEQQLMKEQSDFNADLKKRLDNFLVAYNKEKGYDYIFSYSEAGPLTLLYVNPEMDITKDVLDGMNKQAGAEKEGPATAIDTTKK